MDIKEKRKLLHVLMHKSGISQRKADILSIYGVESSTQLTESELDELILSIKNSHNQAKRQDSDLELRTWRSKILTRLTDMKVYTSSEDWSRVNAFLKDSRIAGKYLYQMTAQEMKALDNKLRSIQDKNRKKEAELRRLQQQN